MERVLTILLLSAGLAGLTACENQAEREQALHGKWALDSASYKDTLIETLRKHGLEPGATEMAQIEAEISSRQLEYEFKPDRTWALSGTVQGRPVSAKGDWWYADGQYCHKCTEENGKPQQGLTYFLTVTAGKLIMETYTGPVPYAKKT